MRPHTSAILATSLLLASDVCAFWRMACDNPLAFETSDPIVTPGTTGPHVHNVAGGHNFGPGADYTALRQSSCTSCPIKEDLSAYWTPALYYKYANGSFKGVPNGGTTVYYLQRGSDTTEAIQAFPAGFKMVAGDPDLRTYNESSRAQQAISYVCLDYAGGSSDGSAFPEKNCPDGMRAQVIFPSCWDGKNLDSSDHRSHVAYPTGISSGSCDDAKYPVRLVTIFYEIFYDVNAFAKMWYDDASPFVLANGDPHGYSLHGDFLNGWDVDVLQRAIDTCDNNSGLIDDCDVFTIQHPKNSAQQCRKDSVANGSFTNLVIDSLPGCNPVWNGTGTKPACVDAEEVSTISVSTTAMVASRTGEVAISTTLRASTTAAASTASSHSGSTQQLRPAYVYRGCYIDQRSPRVLSTRVSQGDGSTSACAEACQTYVYLGLEYGGECWCGNTAPTTALRLDAECDMVCRDDSFSRCGGGFRLQVYASSV